MEKNNQIYETIRELILLGFYVKKNYQVNQMSLGEYRYENKKYEIYSSWSKFETSIFIKCDNNGLHLIIEDDENSRRFGGSISNDVYLRINKYKNIDFYNVVYPYFLREINRGNVIYESKIELDYSQGKKFIFNGSESFDKELKNEKCIELFKDEFSPEIILNLIEQIYPNLEQININNKIDGIIKSLSEEELVTLNYDISNAIDRFSQTEKSLNKIIDFLKIRPDLARDILYFSKEKFMKTDNYTLIEVCDYISQIYITEDTDFDLITKFMKPKAILKRVLGSYKRV